MRNYNDIVSNIGRLNYTIKPALRNNSGDERKVAAVAGVLGVKMPRCTKCEFSIKYLYHLKPQNVADYAKLISKKAQDLFQASFGAPDVRTFRDGDEIILEAPGADDCTVYAGDILRNDAFAHSPRFDVAIGKRMNGENLMMDLDKAPHMLIGGETGSGKSIFIHQVICSLLLKHAPGEIYFYMVDPKRVELWRYAKLPNANVVQDSGDAARMLDGVCRMMDERYRRLQDAGCRDIVSFNQSSSQLMARVVVVIDELADLMCSAEKKSCEQSIKRIAQLGRAAGIHLIIATQRPDRTVVTGLIKDNIPTRVCLSVSSGINSRIILDRMGGEKLRGHGDLLYLANGAHDAVRCQGSYLSENEIDSIVNNYRRR